MVSVLLPHTQSMIDLARLTALVGIYRESEGRWREAADVYLAILRMGRQMTYQTTLTEAITGVDRFETGYFALGRWAAYCPEASLIEEAFDLLAASASDMVQPARIMQSEASILKMRREALREAYPDGPWTERVLETLAAPYPAAGPEGLRKAAKAAAIERGVPAAVSHSKESFLEYLDELSAVAIDKANARALCLTRPTSVAILTGEKIAEK